MESMQYWNRLGNYKKQVLASKEPLVGLRYLIYVKDNFVEPFICILCTQNLETKSKQGGLLNMLNHIKSRSHQRKLLELEFPGVFKKIMEFKNKFDSTEDHIDNIIKLVCVEIFAQNKFLALTIADRKSYFAKRSEIFQKIQNYKPQKDPRLLEVLHHCVENYKRTLKTCKLKPSEVSQEKEKIKAEPSDHQQKENLIEKYEKLCGEETEKIKSLYKFYKFQPDIHPKYKKEWNLYWCQMQAANKLDKVNEQWISDWPNRLNELEYLDILRAKISIRSELQMPIDEFNSQELKEFEKKEDEKWKWHENHLMQLGTIKKEKEQEIIKESLKRQNSNSSMDTIPENDMINNLNSNESFETIAENQEVTTDEVSTIETRSQVFLNPQMSHCPQELIAYRQNFVNFKLPAKRKPLIDIDEISKEISSKMCKISNPNVQSHSESSTTTLYPGTSEDSFDKNSSNSNSSNVEQPHTLTESFNGVEFKEICILFNNLDRLDDEAKEDLYDFLMKLKKEQPDQYKRLMNMDLNNQHEINNSFDKDDDDYDFSELITSIKKEFKDRDDEQQQLVYKSPIKKTSTVCIDLTMDD